MSNALAAEFNLFAGIFIFARILLCLCKYFGEYVGWKVSTQYKIRQCVSIMVPALIQFGILFLDSENVLIVSIKLIVLSLVYLSQIFEFIDAVSALGIRIIAVIVIPKDEWKWNGFWDAAYTMNMPFVILMTFWHSALILRMFRLV